MVPTSTTKSLVRHTPRGKRVFTSVVSTFLALLASTVLASLIGWRGITFSGVGKVFFDALPLCFAGWLLALPMVLPEGRLPGGTVGMLLYGCSAGPLVFCAAMMALAFAGGGPDLSLRVANALGVFEAFHGRDTWLRDMMLFAASISAMTTVLYLSLLRFSRRIQSPTL